MFLRKRTPSAILGRPPCPGGGQTESRIPIEMETDTVSDNDDRQLSTAGETDPGTSGRRRFIAIAAAGVAAAWTGVAAWPVYRYLAPQPVPDPFGKEGRAPVEKIVPADVAGPASGKNGAYAGRGLIVLRNADGELKAFDSKCTHAGCNVQFDGNRIYCHCHGGTYDLNGKNIAGPPPKPLTELRVFEDGGALFVARMDGAGRKD